MIAAKIFLAVFLCWGLSERSFVAWRSRQVSDTLLLLIAIATAGLVVLSWF